MTSAALGCGGGDDNGGDGTLVWSGKPRIIVPPTLPGDRILRGDVRNDSLRPLELAAGDLHLVTKGGQRVPASVAFLGSFIRSVEPYNSGPQELPEDELRRLGRKVKLLPGKSAPLTVSWHARQGRPVSVDYRSGNLPVPSKP